MTAEDLYQEVIDNLQIKAIHPLHKAMLEECCEHAINNNITDKETLRNAAMIAFMTTNSTLQGTLKAGLKMADNVTLNYRGQSFTIDANSKLLGD